MAVLIPRGGEKISTLLNQRPLGINRLQANRFDGKSDGKNYFVILFLIFTVKPDLKLLKSLQLTEFFALQIVGLGNS